MRFGMQNGILNMHTMKTAISVEDTLMEEADKAAAEQGVSRSKLVSLALEEYLKKRRGEQITAKLNEIYANDDQAEELEFVRFAKAKMLPLLDEW